MIQNEASHVAELLEPHSPLTRSSCHHVWVWTVMYIITNAPNLWYRTMSKSVLFCTLYCMCQFTVWTDRYQLYSSQCEPHSRLPHTPDSETLQEYLFSLSDMQDSKLEKTHQCTLQIGPVLLYCLVVIDKVLRTTHLTHTDNPSYYQKTVHFTLE